MTRFDIVFPARGRQHIDGGLNTKYERTRINDNESPDALNVIFSDGTVATNPGYDKLNTSAVGSFVCDGLYTRRTITGAESMVAFFGGTAWALGTTTFITIGSGQSVFTAGVRVGATNYENHLFMGNGYVNPYKYNGTDFTRHGVPIATGAVAVASGAAGALTGDYRYKITYVNSQVVEGDVGTATVTFAAAAARLDLSNIPVAPQSHGVAARRIYRTAAGGTTFKLVATLNDNTTTTYQDNNADSTLGANAPTDQGEPPRYSIVCYHQNRLFCNQVGSENLLWYSELGEPYTFKVTNFLAIGDASSDLIRGIDVYQNNLVIRCDNSSWIVYMPSTDSADWQVIKIASAYGSKAPFGAFAFQDKFAFPAMQNDKFVGYAVIAGTTIDPTATVLEMGAMGSELYSEPVEPVMFDAQRAYLQNMTAFVFANKAYIAFTKASNNTTNNYVLIFDYSLGRLNKDQKATWALISGWPFAQFTSYGGRLYAGSSTANGFVYRLINDTYDNASSAINSYVWTKEFSGLPGHENMIKDFRKVKLLVDLAGDYSMDVGIRVDSDETDVPTTYEIDLNPESNLWNTLIWGAGVWGGGRTFDEKELSLNAVSGRRIQFRFSNRNTSGQRFKVHGINFTYNIRGTT